jgi:hypothetical protein
MNQLVPLLLLGAGLLLVRNKISENTPGPTGGFGDASGRPNIIPPLSAIWEDVGRWRIEVPGVAASAIVCYIALDDASSFTIEIKGDYYCVSRSGIELQRWSRLAAWIPTFA